MNQRDGSFLEMADRLGARLCRDAIWAGNRCNWVGAGAVALGRSTRVAAQRACGPDLFSGTSGIASFLGRLHAATGEKIFGLTAEGAMRQALSRLDDVARPKRSGFYAGLTGVAYVLFELAEILDAAKFQAMAMLILKEVSEAESGRHELSLTSGSAGAIPALLELHRKHAEDFLLALAIAHGDRLLDADREGDIAWTCDEDLPTHRGSGLARQADGIAWSLLELAHATGEDRFRHAAEHAFQRSELWDGQDCQDSQEAWRDTIGESATWFSRAPAIGLARLRAFEVLGDDCYLRDAKAVLPTVMDLLSESSNRSNRDFCLAHGQAGDAELLLHAGQRLGDQSYRAAAERVAHRGITLYRNGDLPWPCGTPGGAETPGLMLGLAGIGDFFLGLYDPLRTPTLLMLLPPSGSA